MISDELPSIDNVHQISNKIFGIPNDFDVGDTRNILRISTAHRFAFSKIQIELKQWLIFGGIGIALGYFWSTTIKVYRKEDGVYNKNTLLYIVVWGVTFGLSQFFASLRAEYVNAAMLSSILSAGIVVGMNGMLLKQYLDLSKQQTKSKNL